MIAIGDFLYDPRARRLIRGQEELRLSPKAAGVLAMLAEAQGSVCSRDALLQRVWPDAPVGEEVLTQAIAELRRALGDNARRPRYLATVHKSGYRIAVSAGPRALPPATAAIGITLDDFAEQMAAETLLQRGGVENTLAASELFAALLDRKPHFALAQFGRGKAMTYLGTVYRPSADLIAEALMHFEATLRLNPLCADAAAWRGYALVVAGAAESGLESFRKALELNSDCVAAHWMLGRVALARAELKPARVIYDRTAELSRGEVMPTMTAALLRNALGDEAGARRGFAAAAHRLSEWIAGAPHDVTAQRNLARCLLELGKLDEAHALIESVRHAPDNNHFNMACVLARAGDTEGAIEALQTGAEQGLRAIADRLN